MSTLNELIAMQNASSPPRIRCIEKEYHPVAMVTFYPWQAMAWALPWSHLNALSFRNLAEQEHIELLFPHHHVVLVGENLQETLDPLCTFMVRGLRALPDSHRARLRPGEPFIERLEVRLLGEAKRCSTEAGPFQLAE